MDALTLQMTKAKQEAIETTIRKERSRLFNFIRKRVPDKDDAEDILQDVFFQFVNGYGTIESIEKTTSWLFTVARNKITDLYRKRKNNISIDSDEEFGDDSPISLREILPDMSRGAEDEMIRSVIWSAIEEALDELPPEQKEVFVLNEFEEMSFKDIAEKTGVSINTLLSRKRYAVLFMRKKLQDIYNEINS